MLPPLCTCPFMGGALCEGDTSGLLCCLPQSWGFFRLLKEKLDMHSPVPSFPLLLSESRNQIPTWRTCFFCCSKWDCFCRDFPPMCPAWSVAGWVRLYTTGIYCEVQFLIDLAFASNKADISSPVFQCLHFMCSCFRRWVGKRCVIY